MAEPDIQTLEVGSTANSYEILAKLATGGMAEIFLARAAAVAGVERYVVLKRVLRQRAQDIHFVRMFLDEARLAAQLQHQNVAQVYDIGKLGDSFFFTMEYVHGETVRALMHRAHALGKPIPVSCVLTIIAGAAAGLHHAHDRVGVDGKKLNVVHRDVSPSNLMISYEGSVKVVDFGVAKATHRLQETHSGTVKGKIGYLSPEQCRGRAIDRRSDLFSLGIVMWEMLVTERLYRKDSDFDNMQSIVNDPPVPPSKKRDDVPKEVDAVVLKLLAKSPDDRYQTADELLEAVETTAAKLGIALSGSSLGRFVRELFGQRPEPWIEMKANDAHPEVVTVTSEPIPANLDDALASMMESQLAHIPDLSAGKNISSSWSAEAKRPPTAQTPIDRPHSTPASGVRKVTPASGVRPVTAPPVALANASERSGTPSLAGAVEVQSRSDVSIVAPSGRRRLGLAIAALAGVAGLGVGAYAALRGGGAKTAEPAAEPVAQPSHAPPVATPPDAPAVAVAPEPAQEPSKIEVDPPAPPTPRATDPSKPKSPTKPPRPTAPAHDDIAGSFQAGRYADVVTACAALPRLGELAVPCTLSACHLNDDKHARKWIQSLPADKRAALATACENAGTVVETKPPAKPRTVDSPRLPVETKKPVKPPVQQPAKPDCGDNPLDCQH